MGYLKVWIHLVWATKCREPLLTRNVRYKLFSHIRENAGEKDIYIDFVNGYTDHVHVLLSLAANQTISKIAQLIKGESSFWVNQQRLITQRFEWQDDYFAASVSPWELNKIRAYIKNQEQHHQAKTFQEEYNELLEKHVAPVLSPGQRMTM